MGYVDWCKDSLLGFLVYEIAVFFIICLSSSGPRQIMKNMPFDNPRPKIHPFFDQSRIVNPPCSCRKVLGLPKRSCRKVCGLVKRSCKKVCCLAKRSCKKVYFCSKMSYLYGIMPL